VTHARPVSWPLLPVPDEHGRLAFPGFEDSVRQQIRVILLTRPGEQLMRPQFGGGLGRFVDQPNTADTRRLLREVVEQALAAGEPRIVVEHVGVEEIADQPTAVRVDITYQLRRTGLRKQLGMTMTLGG
jgi:uncharacterized protein